MILFVVMGVIGFGLGALLLFDNQKKIPWWHRVLGGVLVSAMWILVPLMIIGPSDTVYRPTSTTSTTIPNTDPTVDWVYENKVYRRCDGPHMLYKPHYHSDVITVVENDPRCVAAFTGTSVPR